MNLIIVTIKFLIGAVLCNCALAASPIVKIKNGTLEGTIMKTRNNRNIIGFRGVPYALPPIKELRFKVN